MKKTLLFASAIAMALAFVACNDDDDCTPYNPPVPPPVELEVTTNEGVQDALELGVQNITLTEPLTEDASFVIPNSYSPSQQLTLEIPAGGSDITITQESGHGGVFPVLNLVAEDVNNLILSVPSLSVSYSGTVLGSLTASTAPNTLTLESSASVNTLNVNKGNVYVFGQVENYGTIADGSKIVRPVATAEELRTMLAGTEPYNGGVVLMADIHYIMPTINGAQANQNAFVVGTVDYKGEESTAFDPELDPYNGYIFDGNGYTIGGAAQNNVLMVFANNAVVKNLKIQQNDADRAALTAANRGNNGITIYRSRGVKLDNVTINSTQKAGMVISASTVTATKLTTNGNTWGGVNVSSGVFPSGGGIPEFTLVSGNLNEAGSGPYKIWVDLGTLPTPESFVVNVPAGWISSLNGNNQRYYYPAE